MEWPHGTSPVVVARRVLEELGISESQRRIFISYKREDGLLAAEQLFDHVGKHGSVPSLIGSLSRRGRTFRRPSPTHLRTSRSCCFLRHPAHMSPWVFYEVDYTLSHGMGIHIVTWPGRPAKIPGSDGLARQSLQEAGSSEAEGLRRAYAGGTRPRCGRG